MGSSVRTSRRQAGADANYLEELLQLIRFIPRLPQWLRHGHRKNPAVQKIPHLTVVSSERAFVRINASGTSWLILCGRLNTVIPDSMQKALISESLLRIPELRVVKKPCIPD